MIDLSLSETQAEIAEIVGISQPAISCLLTREILTVGANLGQWLTEYCSHLREMVCKTLSLVSDALNSVDLQEEDEFLLETDERPADELE